MPMALLTLDVDGIISAIVIARALIYLGINTSQGGYLGAFYVFVMLYFLALSAIATRFGESYKKKSKLYQETRGIKNVLANGLGPLIFALVAYWLVSSGSTGTQGFSFAVLAGFIASVAGVTADKFSSEIGILDGAPTSIVTFKKLRKGTSGGITLLGLGAGLFGSFCIAAIAGYGAVALFPPHLFVQGCTSGCLGNVGAATLTTVIALTLAGFVGTLVDSLLGHWEEKGIGNKYTTNFACSIAGGAVGLLLLGLVYGL